jgi:hypothetical protein
MSKCFFLNKRFFKNCHKLLGHCLYYKLGPDPDRLMKILDLDPAKMSGSATYMTLG